MSGWNLLTPIREIIDFGHMSRTSRAKGTLYFLESRYADNAANKCGEDPIMMSGGGSLFDILGLVTLIE
ncbi:hypothetical protein GCM10008961_29750 [Deinococcus knuensis]|uniref:Uncharacterized protein n=1 Tax=Deinococcus knuensis TaxID=1837380 RepID=A0ABQ2SPI2_9DEIO|nr:hypothetical protein GCM10008961_29750 [Deinococcus knuensis]